MVLRDADGSSRFSNPLGLGALLYVHVLVSAGDLGYQPFPRECDTLRSWVIDRLSLCGMKHFGGIFLRVFHAAVVLNTEKYAENTSRVVFWLPAPAVGRTRRLPSLAPSRYGLFLAGCGRLPVRVSCNCPQEHEKANVRLGFMFGLKICELPIFRRTKKNRSLQQNLLQAGVGLG